VPEGGVAPGVPAGGDEAGPVGVDDGLELGVTTAVDGDASGEFEPVWLLGCGTQAAKNNTSPATHAAGTAPLLTTL
jgi:hypothetical protein